MSKKHKIIITIIATLFLLPIVILFSLSKSYENHQHNIGTSWNVVFISEDWHQEIVFDSNKNRVVDPINMWSYNFAHPTNEPFNHFKLDTLPWILWWNSPDDTSTKNQRIIAFLKDFCDWFLRTIWLIN